MVDRWLTKSADTPPSQANSASDSSTRAGTPVLLPDVRSFGATPFAVVVRRAPHPASGVYWATATPCVLVQLHHLLVDQPAENPIGPILPVAPWTDSTPRGKDPGNSPRMRRSSSLQSHETSDTDLLLSLAYLTNGVTDLFLLINGAASPPSFATQNPLSLKIGDGGICDGILSRPGTGTNPACFQIAINW